MKLGVVAAAVLYLGVIGAAGAGVVWLYQMVRYDQPYTVTFTVATERDEAAGFLGAPTHWIATTDGRVFRVDDGGWVLMQPGHTYQATDERHPGEADGITNEHEVKGK